MQESSDTFSENREHPVSVQNGWLWLFIVLSTWVLSIGLIVTAASGRLPHPAPKVPVIASGIVLIIVNLVLSGGFFTLQPNEARVLILFGKYVGTVRESGFHWGNPFYSNDAQAQIAVATQGQHSSSRSPRHKVSLRARNLNGERLKVNDKNGNPIEIAAVVVWRVQDTAQAKFDVDDYQDYVRVQYESALRHLASGYAYDDENPDTITLRSSMDEVSQALALELQERLKKAGVVVEEARIAHLAYAPEIAQTMLRRQQAEAVIAARQKIVHGAVSMVELALKEMSEKGVIDLDEERKAAMVSNLMVVLCGESEVHPVINAGTLYN
ncbi:MAG TPA: SPFH domain-containing protein [Opitutales bacterium]|nr:SPFH domain-containing protein [Opitutales bacterium]